MTSADPDPRWPGTDARTTARTRRTDATGPAPRGAGPCRLVSVRTAESSALGLRDGGEGAELALQVEEAADGLELPERLGIGDLVLHHLATLGHVGILRAVHLRGQTVDQHRVRLHGGARRQHDVGPVETTVVAGRLVEELRHEPTEDPAGE